MGNGNGTFQPQQAFAVGSRPYSVAVADLIGDGRPDIVTTDYGSNSVSVLLNNGGGSFRRAADVRHRQRTGPDRWSADFNGDGLPDLADPQQPRQHDRRAPGQG